MRLFHLLGLAVFFAVAACAPQGAVADKVWTRTDPPINATHIFLGEINRSGKPTGFHSRPEGENPKSARVIAVGEGPNSAGVYTAQIEVRDPDSGRWKQKFSTFFPDALNHAEVVSAILHAYQNREHGHDEPWRGPSGLGFQIQGYNLRDGRINTAFPVYVRDRRQ